MHNLSYFSKEFNSSPICAEDLNKISRLFSALSNTFKSEGIQMTSCDIGKNLDHGNIYIYSEDLSASIFINDDIDKIQWLYNNFETGEELFFNSYNLVKKYIEKNIDESE